MDMTQAEQKTSIDYGEHPEIYVQENWETLIEIIKHSNDTFMRSFCLAAIVKFGEDPEIDQLKEEVAHLEDLKEKLE
jgi:hypothetical protein